MITVPANAAPSLANQPRDPESIGRRSLVRSRPWRRSGRYDRWFEALTWAYPTNRITSWVEDRTRAEASRNCRQSSSRATHSSSRRSERRITSVLDRALSNRRNSRTCAYSAGARVNGDFPEVLDFMFFIRLALAKASAQRRNPCAAIVAGVFFIQSIVRPWTSAKSNNAKRSACRKKNGGAEGI